MLRLLLLLALASCSRAYRALNDADADRVMAALEGGKSHQLQTGTHDSLEGFPDLTFGLFKGKEQPLPNDADLDDEEGEEGAPRAQIEKEYYDGTRKGEFKKEDVDKVLDEFEDLGQRYSPYYNLAMNHLWAALSFEERWEEMRTAVPLDELQDHWDSAHDTGPVCWPSSDGPKDSKKLAILIHGFTSCPGTFGALTQRLVAAGHRVLRPLLPGHGRKYKRKDTKTCQMSALNKGVSQKCIKHFLMYSCNWTHAQPCGTPVPPGRKMSREAYKCCCDEKLGELEEGAKPCSGEEVNVEFEDDLTTMPLTPGPFLVFAEALGKLVESFKREHPDGHITVLGHSLGGMVAAKFALERPQTVDRLLLMNPMLSLPSSFVKPLISMLHGTRAYWEALGEPECEHRRAESGGGYCQFLVGNVGAMSDLAYLVLCRHWGMSEFCKFSDGTTFGITAGVGAGTGAGIALGSAAGAGAGAAAAAGMHVFSAMGLAPWMVASGLAGGTHLAAAGAIAAAGAKGGMIGALGGPAAPATVPAGIIIGIVFASLGVAVVGGLAGKAIASSAFEAQVLLAVRNATTAQEIRQRWGLLKEFQMLGTVGDPAVSNDAMKTLYSFVEPHRDAQGTSASFGKSGYGYWPKEVGHSYSDNRFVDPAKGWYWPYVENAVQAFCLDGTKIPVLNTKDFSIFTNPSQIQGKLLTIIPAYFFRAPGQKPICEIAREDGSALVESVFDGRVQRFCEYRMFQRRWDEVTVYDPNHEGMLLVRKQGWNSDKVKLYVFKSPVYRYRDESCDKPCVSAPLASLQANEPLFKQLKAISSSWDSYKNVELVELCKENLVNVICSKLNCTTATTQVTGEPEDKMQLWGSDRKHMTFVNKMTCDVRFRSFFGKEVVVQPNQEAQTDWAYNVLSFWAKPKGVVQYQSCVGSGEEVVYAGQTLTILPDDSLQVDD